MLVLKTIHKRQPFSHSYCFPTVLSDIHGEKQPSSSVPEEVLGRRRRLRLAVLNIWTQGVVSVKERRFNSMPHHEEAESLKYVLRDCRRMVSLAAAYLSYDSLWDTHVWWTVLEVKYTSRVTWHGSTSSSVQSDWDQSGGVEDDANTSVLRLIAIHQTSRNFNIYVSDKTCIPAIQNIGNVTVVTAWVTSLRGQDGWVGVGDELLLKTNTRLTNSRFGISRACPGLVSQVELLTEFLKCL